MGILQGDTLSLILFILAVNPLSYLLAKEDGFALTVEEQTRIITHLFFVDDLKLYAKNVEKLKALLEIVISFTNEVGMKFGESKCAYNVTETGKRKHQGKELELEGLRIKELPEEDNYKYLGMDESIGYDGPLNKNRVTSEYKKRVRKIWSSELNNINKVQAHNTFAAPVLTPTIGVLPWTKKEIKDLDILTRKQMSMQRSFHVSSEVNRLYARRNEGGRGLTSTEEMYKRRTTGIAEHLEEAQKDNSMLKLVRQH